MKKIKLLSLCVIVIMLVNVLVIFSNAQDKKQLTFMMISRNIADPFHAVIANGAKNTCAELGVRFILKDSNVDLTTQLNIIDSAITMGVDGVAINAVDEKGVIPGIKALNDAGIPVVGFDVVAEGGKMIGAIGIDNYEIAHAQAVILGKLLEDKYKGNIPSDGVILNLQGAMAILIAQERSNGFTDYFKKYYPQLKIASAQGNFNPTDTNRVTMDLLTRYGNKVIGVNLVAGCAAAGVNAAFESSGYSLKDVIFVDSGNFPIDNKLIDEGKLDCSVVVPCSPQGVLAMKILYWYINGMTDKLPVPGELMIEEGAAWSPATVIEGPVGPVIQENCGLLCPQDVSTTDPILLANEVIALEK